jgi:hypothetical protein
MRTLIVAGGLLLAAACRPAPPPLAPAFDSPEALARAVLELVATEDVNGLRALALTEQEFRTNVWPELPAARPERNLPFSYVWGDLRQKSDAGLSSVLSRYRAHRLELVAVRFGGRTPYTSYVVHRDAVFSVRDTATHGPLEEIRVCGSLIEQAGRWKVFSYVVDD